VLQDRVVQRLGARESTQVEVRLICATHRSIERLVANAQFREDLWYRINSLYLQIPPLRQRLDDILWLARNYLEAFSLKNGGPIRILDSSARAWMLTHTWPGNVRELFNRLERACILFDTEVIRARHLIDPERIDDVEASLPTLSAFMEEAERDCLASTLKRYGGRVSQTASQLGISRKTLWEKSRRHGLTASEPSDTSQRVSD
jgi:DNA-binding NtrC family response regulator